MSRILATALAAVIAWPSAATVVQLAEETWSEDDLVALPALWGAALDSSAMWHTGPVIFASHNARMAVFHSFDDKAKVAMQSRFAAALGAVPYRAQRSITNVPWLPDFVVIGYGDEAWWPCHAANLSPGEMLHEGRGSSCLNVTDGPMEIPQALPEAANVFLAFEDLHPGTFDGSPFFRQFAHAYHHYVIKNGLDNQCIRRAYKKAMDQGLYDQVRQSHRRSGIPPHRRVPQDVADASWNHVEWFAETAVSYFLINDEYPFHRHDLYEHDPDGYTVQRHFWEHPNTGVGRCPVSW